MSQTTTPSCAPEVDVLAVLESRVRATESHWGMPQGSDENGELALAAVSALLTREAALVAERDALAAEVGALREAAIEWRTLGSPLLEVLVMEGTDPFVTAAHGRITTVIDSVEKDLLENPLDYFDEKGEGLYIFRAHFFSGQYGEFGQCELAPGWELDLLSFEPMEVAIDAARAEAGQGCRSSETE